MTTATKSRLKHKSLAVTEGPHRAPARSMLRAVGLTDEDMDKPFVAVGNLASDVTPCNVHLTRIAERVKEGVRDSGSVPFMFGTITVSDGISMGTEGMKGSLVSREVIADSIETITFAESMDGADRRGRLRQEHARRHDGDGAPQRAGALRVRGRHPARPFQRRGREYPGHVRGRGRLLAGQDDARRPARHGARRVSGRGCLLRYVHSQHDGVCHRGDGDVHPRRGVNSRRWTHGARMSPRTPDGRSWTCWSGTSSRATS